MEVNFREWLSEMVGHVRENPRRSILYFVYSLYLTVWYAITSRRPFGRNIYKSDWDLLVVLDACRVDTLREVADEYEFIDDVDSVWSVGSTSPEWIANTFREDWIDEIGDTAYISANGYSTSVLEKEQHPPSNNTTPIDLSTWSAVDIEDFRELVSLWQSHHDERYSSVLPETVTDRTIVEGRHRRADRLLVHYIQPHLPYIGIAYSEGREPTDLEHRGYQLLEEGSASREAVYEAYRENLRLVLDEVAVLLENIDAEKVVITADHGEAFGEWAAYGHPEGFPRPIVRKVPWVETSAIDRRTRDPDVEAETGVNVAVEEHLRDLGYH